MIFFKAMFLYVYMFNFWLSVLDVNESKKNVKFAEGAQSGAHLINTTLTYSEFTKLSVGIVLLLYYELIKLLLYLILSNHKLNEHRLFSWLFQNIWALPDGVI